MIDAQARWTKAQIASNLKKSTNRSDTDVYCEIEKCATTLSNR